MILVNILNIALSDSTPVFCRFSLSCSKSKISNTSLIIGSFLYGMKLNENENSSIPKMKLRIQTILKYFLTFRKNNLVEFNINFINIKYKHKILSFLFVLLNFNEIFNIICHRIHKNRQQKIELNLINHCPSSLRRTCTKRRSRKCSNYTYCNCYLCCSH
jgi:hypothetical protein